MDNRAVAQHLTEKAHRLADEMGNVFRAQAYRRAAETVMGLQQPIELILESEGRRGLERLPGIGRRISRTIAALFAFEVNPNTKTRNPKR